MSVIDHLRRRTSVATARRQSSANELDLKRQLDAQAQESSRDASAARDAQGLEGTALGKIEEAADQGHDRVDVHRIEPAEYVQFPLPPYARANPRFLLGPARGLFLWALQERFQVQVERRDNGKWEWRQSDSTRGIFHPFRFELDGYEEWEVLSVSWRQAPTGDDAKRRGEQRKKTDPERNKGDRISETSLFLLTLIASLRARMAKEPFTADQLADAEHHLRWVGNRPSADSVVSITAAALALGLNLADLIA
jgi:hypothetical protein